MSGARPDTWMPFYVGDYLRDTGRLTTEGHGAYLLLILDYWTSGAALPDDDDQLAAIVRLPLQRWQKLRPLLEKFFRVDNGVWWHKRVEQEIYQANAITELRSIAGIAGANARWSHKQKHGNRTREPLANVKQTVWQNDAQSQSQSPEESISSASRPPPRKRSAKTLLNGHIEEFEEIYSAYPRHVARGAAERAFLAALKETDFQTLLAGVRAYARSVEGKEPQYIAHFATWLRQKRWLDQGPGDGGVSEYGPPTSAPPTVSRERLGELG